jgi:hypothetical protein
MAAEAPRVEFALGSEVSPGHFFKSSFARSFVSASCRDSTKSLDYEFYENGTIAEEPVDAATLHEHRNDLVKANLNAISGNGSCNNNSSSSSSSSSSSNNNNNNNFYSLVNFGPDVGRPNPTSWRAGQVGRRSLSNPGRSIVGDTPKPL